MSSGIYLDHNATAPLHPLAAAAMSEALKHTGNPSSIHSQGRAARRRVEEARASVANLVDVAPEAVILTSGGTEANALGIRGAECSRVLVSAVEHACVREAVPDAETVPVDRDGRVQVDQLETMLRLDPRPALVCVMAANNETGVLQPLDDVVAVANRHGARVHCDAVQAAGRLPLSMERLGVDSLALSAHKLGGPMGVGALVTSDAGSLVAQLTGGGQERRRRAGTENVPGIAGFGAAAQCATAALTETERLAQLRDRLEAALRTIAGDVEVFGYGVPRLPNTSCFATPGLGSEVQIIALDLAGIAVGAGAACSSGSVAASHVLTAMGVDPRLAACALRVSMGPTTTAADIDGFLAAWRGLVERVRGRAVEAA